MYREKCPAIVFLLFAFVCGSLYARSQPETESIGADDSVVVTIANWDIANSFPETGENDPARAFIEDKFGITIRPAGITWGDAVEKLNIWAASGQLPDVIGGIDAVGSGQYHQWIDDGLVQPLPEDISDYPHIRKFVDVPEVRVFDVDGRTYILPRMTYEDPSWWAMDRGFLVRKDWRRQLGIETPHTSDEFIDMCVQFAKADPDGDGVDNTVGLAVAQVGFLYSQGFPNFGYTDARWVEDTDGRYRLGHTTRNAFELFSFIRRLYRKGGLDPDFAIASGDLVIEQFSAGQVGVLLRQVSPKHLGKVATVWDKLQPDLAFEDSVEILPMWDVQGRKTKMFVEKSYWSESYIEASVDDEKMRRILELYDFLYSDEGIALCYFGFEGEDYARSGDLIELMKHGEDGNSMNAEDLYPIMSGGFAYLAVWSDIFQYVDPSIPSAVTEMARKERERRFYEWKVPEVDWAVQAIHVPEKQSLAIDFGADWIMFILDDSGRSDEEIFADMQATWRANGYDAAVDAVTAIARKMSH